MAQLRGGGLRGRKAFSDDVNPMEGTANLADAMLVFACGLLLALMAYWGIDPAGEGAVSGARQVEDVAQSQDAGNASTGEEGYDELGVVYRDPETGKMYLVEGD